MEPSSWRELFSDLKSRRPELAQRVCRRLLVDLQRRGLVDFEDLDRELAVGLRLVGDRASLDPNRPKPKLPKAASEKLHELALRFAEQYLPPEEIAATILLTEKRQLAFEVSRLAEDLDTPLDALKAKIQEFLNFETGEAVMQPEDLIGTRAALVRRLLTDQLDFIGVAKKYIKVRDFGHVMEHIIPTEGKGRLGGKAAGLILARSVLLDAQNSGKLDFDFHIPVSYYLPASGTLDFIEHNGLEELINVKYKPIDEVREEYPLVEKLFKSSAFPPIVHRGLQDMLERVRDVPLVVRSSSLLEDRIGHAFSGKYKSLFIANRGPLEKRLADLEDAIAEVYASIFHPDPIEYRRERGLLDFQENMGVLIQEVVGTEVGGMVLPAFAGVAFSRCEMRWSPRIKRSDGIARLVLGLGTRAVDRTVDDYPVLVALDQPSLRAMQRPEDTYRYSQMTVDVIDLKVGQFDSISLPQLLRRVARKLPSFPKIFSVYRNNQLLPVIGMMTQLDPDELVVTFDRLLSSGFPGQLKQVLDLLEEGLGEPVDVEFAHDGDKLYVLQCRAMAKALDAEHTPVPVDIPSGDVVFTARRYVQTGQLRNLEYLVLVDPRDYQKLQSHDDMRRVAQVIGAVNRALPERTFILMGPGRWGSRGDISLGVPATYADICHTTMLVEIARRKGSYLPEVSFGTHFFQDLVESRINYLPLYPDEPDTVWNEGFLTSSPNSLAAIVPQWAQMEHVVRVIHVPEAADGRLLQVIMDGEADYAMAFLAPRQ